MSARIYGTVKSSSTGTPITNAVVTAPPYAVTNTNGAYQFFLPGAATVDVTATASGYHPLSKTVTIANGGAKKVDFLLVPL